MSDAVGIAPRATASWPLALLSGALLFGDYLSLTVSNVLTGTSGNWIAVSAVLQPLIVLVALVTRQIRRRLSVVLALAWFGLCAVALGHAVPVWLNGDSLTEYSQQKLLALLLLAGPALVAGHVLGAQPRLPGARTMPWLMAPLIALCGAAVATDPRLLTIEFYATPPVFLGFLVLPTHQPLAFTLTKAALLAFAADPGAARSRLVGALRLGAVGALTGLVLLTGARSYTIGFVASLAAVALLSGRRVGILLLGGTIAVALFQLYAGDTVQERLDPTQMLQSLAFHERELAWAAAWQGFVDHPLFGVGIGCFGQLGGWTGRVYPHNLPLEIAVELGAFGVACFVLLLGGPLVGLLQALGRRTRLDAMAQFAIGLLVFTLLGSLAVGDLIRNHALFFAIGLATAALRRTPEPAASGELAAPAVPLPLAPAGATT